MKFWKKINIKKTTYYIEKGLSHEKKALKRKKRGKAVAKPRFLL